MSELVNRTRVFFEIFLESPRPLPEKVRLAVRNNWFKLRTGSPCCGHPGEPGC